MVSLSAHKVSGFETLATKCSEIHSDRYESGRNRWYHHVENERSPNEEKMIQPILA